MTTLKRSLQIFAMLTLASYAQATVFCKDVINPPPATIGDTYFIELQDGSKVMGTLKGEKIDSLELSNRIVGKSEIRRLFIIEKAGNKVAPSELRFGDEVRIKLFPSGSLSGTFVRNSADGMRLENQTISWNRIERLERTQQAVRAGTIRRTDQVVLLTKDGLVRGEVTGWDAQSVTVDHIPIAKNKIIDAALSTQKSAQKNQQFLIFEEAIAGDKVEITDTQLNRTFEAVVFSKTQSSLVVFDIAQNKKIALGRQDVKSLNLLQRAEEISTVWRR